MAKFDPYDRKSWYFGGISRAEATEILMQERDGGVFLVRDSTSIPGDYVLCVKEDCKVCHYIINKISDDNEGTKYRIGDRCFPDLPSLLAFYKVHYLDTTPLVRPATKILEPLERVIAKHDFDGSDADDLPFKKNEILVIIAKPEEQWWTAQNSRGNTGSVPVPYIKPYDGKLIENVISNEPNKPPSETSSQTSENHSPKRTCLEPNKDTYARVTQARVPNAYDDTALKLKVGDIIRVTKINISGIWEGEMVTEAGKGGKKGHFPFTHVELVDYDPDTRTASPTSRKIQLSD